MIRDPKLHRTERMPTSEVLSAGARSVRRLVTLAAKHEIVRQNVQGLYRSSFIGVCHESHSLGATLAMRVNCCRYMMRLCPLDSSVLLWLSALSQSGSGEGGLGGGPI